MNKFILALLFVTLSMNADNKEKEMINIDFGCLDCKEKSVQKEFQEIEKPVKKYKKKSTIKDNIEISGSLTYRYDKKN